MKQALFLLLILLLACVVPAIAKDAEHEHEAAMAGSESDHDDDHDHDAESKHKDDEHGHEGEDGHDDHEEGGNAELSDAQRRTAGIETLAVERGTVGEAIAAPGEVVLNAYRTTKVTPRIAAQITRRHVRLGELVKNGQALVTLSSVAMAEAQAALLEADIEWRRVKKIGRQVVAEKRFITAEVGRQQALARARAYGMTANQIDALLETQDATGASGEFKLLAAQDGTVISDDFIVGELVEPGHVLFEITDESVLWVEARLTAQAAAGVAIGAPARIKAGTEWLAGTVIQARHTLDETTRTLAVHIEVANPDDRLHAGQFVETVIESRHKESSIVVPLTAVLRSPDGDWQVFVEVAPGRFEPREVAVLRTVGDRMVIDGLAEGTTIVSKGAFFVQSEIAKSGFEVHNH